MKVCGSVNLYCLEVVKSVKVVLLCLMFKEKWDKVVIEKNCINDVV